MLSHPHQVVPVHAAVVSWGEGAVVVPRARTTAYLSPQRPEVGRQLWRWLSRPVCDTATWTWQLSLQVLRFAQVPIRLHAKWAHCQWPTLLQHHPRHAA